MVGLAPGDPALMHIAMCGTDFVVFCDPYNAVNVAM